MDIRVGSVAPTTQVGQAGERQQTPKGMVEARVLAIRPPRKRAEGGPKKRHERSPDRDPAGAKVLVMMIPDGASLPADLATGNYRVFLRFARR